MRMALAGLWDSWRSPVGERVRSFAIITTAPNELCAQLHNRMPAILAPEAWPEWLGEQPADEARLKSLLAPYPSDGMICWPVSARVGNVRNNDSSSSSRSPRRKRPVCPGKFINLDDYWLMLLEISWTIEFFSLARPARKPRPPPAGVFSSQSGALTPQAPPLEQRPYARLMSPQPRGARRRSGPRADRPSCGRRAGPPAPLRQGARA
jgi:hypothetical protein